MLHIENLQSDVVLNAVLTTGLAILFLKHRRP